MGGAHAPKQSQVWRTDPKGTRRKRLSQTDLAKRLGYGQAWVCALETGRLKKVSEDLHKKLAQILGLSGHKRDRDLDDSPVKPNGLIAQDGRIAIPLIRLEDATPGSIEDLIQQSPQYQKRQHRDLTLNTIGAIHQIPKIFYEYYGKMIDLKNIQAYFGRSSAGANGFADNIYQRFRHAYSKREDTWGMILAVTSIEATLEYEKFGISVVERLKEKKGLCIANETGFAKGNVGTAEPGFLYLTFKIIHQSERFASELSKKQIDDAVRCMLEDPTVNRLTNQYEIARAASPVFQQANASHYFGEYEVQVWDSRSNKGSQGVKAFWR